LIAVSNPWREAIEGDAHSYGASELNVFPILRGRLLKKVCTKKKKAFSSFPILRGRLLKALIDFESKHPDMFPILRGRLLKK